MYGEGIYRKPVRVVIDWGVKRAWLRNRARGIA